MFPSLFGGVGGDLAVPQSASSSSASGFSGGDVTIEGLKLGGASDSTLLILGLGALIVLFFIGRK